MKKILTGLVLATCATTASATTYNINAVLDGVDNGFGYSGFHFAGDDGIAAKDSDGNAMTGTELASFTGLVSTGSFDDVTGSFNLVLNLTGGGTVTLSNPGTGQGVFASDPFVLNVDFSAPTTDLYNTTIVFDNTYVCCGTVPGFSPNSFDGTTMSLWGADYALGFGAAETLANAGPRLGLDLRLELTAVPVPAAVWLFGSGLLGLVGIARRKSA